MIVSDKLFLAWNCPGCAKVKSHVTKPMLDDSIKGMDGQILTVIHTFSNDGTRDILDTFNLEDKYAPVLLTHNGEIFDDPDRIVSYLKDNNLID